MLYQDSYPGNFPSFSAWLSYMRKSPTYAGEDETYLYLKAYSPDGESFYENPKGTGLMSLNKEAIQKKYWG